MSLFANVSLATTDAACGRCFRWKAVLLVQAPSDRKHEHPFTVPYESITLPAVDECLTKNNNLYKSCSVNTKLGKPHKTF